jgi:hypothetical protein
MGQMIDSKLEKHHLSGWERCRQLQSVQLFPAMLLPACAPFIRAKGKSTAQIQEGYT